MANYSAVVFPQAGSGGYSWLPNPPSGTVSYASVAPATATQAGALVSPTWNPFSSAAADRTQWWPDTSGTLSLEQAQTACYGLIGMQTAQIKTVTASYNAATDYLAVTINGTTYQVDNTPARQAINLSLAITAQVVSGAAAWAASTAYATGDYCSAGGSILFCSASGTSGTAMPTAPTAFGTAVADGTAAWELLGRKVYLQDGSFVLMTPKNILSAFQQGELALHQMSNKLESLTAQINAGTTGSAVQAIVW